MTHCTHDNLNSVEQEPDGSWIYECADCGELWNEAEC